MEFSEVVAARRSVRSFSGKTLSHDVLTQIVREAQNAPSWVNAQEWKVYIATGEKLETIREQYRIKNEAGEKGYSDWPVTSRETWSEAAQERMAFFTKSREDAGLAATKVTLQNTLFNAPAVAYLTLPKSANLWATLDLGGFEVMLCLAAASRGIGSIPAYNLVKYPDVLRRELSIPGDEAIAVGVALGYADDHAINRFRSVRCPVEEMLTIF